MATRYGSDAAARPSRDGVHRARRAVWGAVLCAARHPATGGRRVAARLHHHGPPGADVVTARLLITCDGTPADRPGMALETCRAFRPTAASTIDAARAEAITAGWSTRWDPATWPAPSEQQDLCPACSRHTTTREDIARD